VLISGFLHKLEKYGILNVNFQVWISIFSVFQNVKFRISSNKLIIENSILGWNTGVELDVVKRSLQEWRAINCQHLYASVQQPALYLAFATKAGSKCGSVF